MPRLCLLLVLSLFACFSNSFGQGLEIAGQVFWKATNEPLAGANIGVKGTQLGTTADINGKFQLSLKDMTEVTLVISYVGFKRTEIKVTASVSDLKVSMDQDILKTSE